MHDIMTMELDRKLQKWAADLQDDALLSKLAGGEMTALEGKQHKRCVKNCFKRYRTFLRQSKASCFSSLLEKESEARACVELTRRIENEHKTSVYLFHLKKTLKRPLIK